MTFRTTPPQRPVVAAIWFLVVAVFCGPAALGASPLVATLDACAPGCPCDDGDQVEHGKDIDGVEHVEGSEGVEHGGDDVENTRADVNASDTEHSTDGDDCANQCRECACSVVSVALPSADRHRVERPSPQQAGAQERNPIGAVNIVHRDGPRGLFRPPRAAQA